jgi:hypothetical protein
MLNKLCSMILLLSVSVSAVANPTCQGKVSGISISASGDVYASVSNGGSTKFMDVVFCNLNKTVGNYHGESCKGLLSLLLSGSAMQKNATLWFQSASFNHCTQSWMVLDKIGFYHLRIDG